MNDVRELVCFNYNVYCRQITKLIKPRQPVPGEIRSRCLLSVMRYVTAELTRSVQVRFVSVLIMTVYNILTEKELLLRLFQLL
jgi:hypothetical protein